MHTDNSSKQSVDTSNRMETLLAAHETSRLRTLWMTWAWNEMLYIAGKIQPDSCYKDITHWINQTIINIITYGQL